MQVLDALQVQLLQVGDSGSAGKAAALVTGGGVQSEEMGARGPDDVGVFIAPDSDADSDQVEKEEGLVEMATSDGKSWTIDASTNEVYDEEGSQVIGVYAPESNSVTLLTRKQDGGETTGLLARWPSVDCYELS